jgi:hypothetical protein
MSSLKIFLSFLFVAIAAGLIQGADWARDSRLPASVPDTRKSALFRPEQLRFAKPNRTFDVSIEAVNGFAQTDDQETTLRATITPESFDGNARYEWDLPADTFIVSGQREGTVNLKSGESIALEITVRGFSSEGLPRNISLDVHGVSKGVVVGSRSVFSSHPTRSDLSIGFRKAKTGRPIDPAVKSKVLDDEDEADAKPEIPKGLHL